MWAITTDSELSGLEQQNGVVAILLAERYDRALLDWLYDCWDELHRDLGSTWHMAVPSKSNIYDLKGDTRRGPAEYNSELSRQLASMYGISEERLPCLVFDDFIEEKRQRYVQLGNRADPDLKRLLRLIARTIGRSNSKTSRSKLIDRVVDAVAIDDALRTLFASAPNIASGAFRLANSN